MLYQTAIFLSSVLVKYDIYPVCFNTGKPLCGPCRLQIDEKCSQSWYLMRVACAGPTHAT
jgi:hypothetical protein